MPSRQDDTDRYLLRNGNEPGAIGQVFDWLLDEWEDPENRDTVIAVPSKTNLDNVQDQLVEQIGEDGFNQIRSSENYTDLGRGVTLHTMTRQIYPSRWNGGPVLGLFVDDDQLEDIDDLRDMSSILVVPWNRDDVSGWEDRWSPDVVDFDSE